MLNSTAEDTSKALAEAVLLARFEPSWFVNHVLRNLDPAGNPLNDPWLDELLEAIADLWRAEMGLPTRVNHQLKNQFTIRSGHGPGKTFGLAQIMHLIGFCWQSQFVCIAPKEKLVTTRLWPRFRKLYQNAIAEYRNLIEINESKIVWNQDRNWVAVPETADKPESLAGYHTNGADDWLVIILDETSGIREDFFPTIYGMLTAPHTILIMIGNPTQNQGEFYRSHRDPKISKDFYSRHVQFGESRYVDKKWAEKMRLRYGADSPVYKIRVLGEFAEVSENQLIPLDWLNAAKLREKQPDGSHPKIRVSVDVADGGDCETVITVTRIYQAFTHYIKQLTFSFPPAQSPIMAADAAERIFIEYSGKKDGGDGGDDFVIDSIGVGAGTAGTLIERGYNVVTFKSGETSDDPEEWRNQRVQNSLVFRNGLRDGWIVFDESFVDNDYEWDEFCAQCCSIRRKPGTERVEDVESKQDLMKRGLPSPDRLDSAMMAMTSKSPAIRRSMGSTIEGVGDTTTSGDNW